MRQRKWWKAVCASVLGASILAGCGTSSNESSNAGETSGEGQAFENMELDVAVFQGGYGREYWDGIAESFMADYPGTKIKITASPKIADIVRPKIVAGNPPDFMYISGSDNTPILDGLIKDHALLDLTALFNEPAEEGGQALKEKILPGVLESPSISPYGDGKIHLAPFNYGVMGLWYNKALLDDKGIQAPATWDEWFQLNATAKENNRALFTYQGLYPGYLEEMIVPAIYSVGGQEALDQFFNYDPEFWKSEAFATVWGNLERIAGEDNALMKGTVALNHTQAQTAFMQGQAMFIPNGTWFEDEMKDAPREDGFQFGFLGVPAFKSGDPVLALTNVEQMVIPAKAKNPELAKEFLKYVYTDKSVQLNAEKSKAVMAVKGAPDLAKSSLSETTYNVYKAVDNGMMAVAGTFKPVAKGSKYNPSEEVYSPISSLMNKQMTLEEYGNKLYEIYTDIQAELAP
ncbi:carbohydrate ABC transporter substrate-binding protein [Paenibacillus sp. P96]|uniref:Carbohydrate ABC transporter substrate-binding protein n=1 Tax=Paenibacillus zeirhizosphaerae TaxID=2987519 RepID=A0ABT9FTT4_9BACL|nr:carbohydrate ABC transporter substrate-binding protein [Paenibacillus sp. P96]MDP4098147.1 carbohydrate ABC transporter substrate-binding protein [Paenibacillus sp. P96]